MNKPFSSNLLFALKKLSPQMILFFFLLHGSILLISFSLFLYLSLNKKSQSNKIQKLDSSTNSFTTSSNPKSAELFSESKTLVKQRLPITSTVPANNQQFVSQLPALPNGLTTQIHSNLPPIPIQNATQLPLYSSPPIKTNIVTSSPNIYTSTPKILPNNNSTKLNTQTEKKAPISSPKKQKTNSQKQKKNTSQISKKTGTNSTNVSKNNANMPQKKYDMEKSKNAISNPLEINTPQPKKILSPTAKPTIKPTVKPTIKPTVKPTTISVEEQVFNDVLLKLDAEIKPADDVNFSQPEKFQSSMSSFNKIIGTVVGKNPQELALILTTQLETKGFQVSQINVYADGFVYEVKKAKFIEYMTLTPDVERKGTIIALWVNPPSNSM
jgi:hypothetical protein